MPKTQPKNKYDWIKRNIWLGLGVFLVAVGIFFRLYQFGQVPISLYWDEMAMLVDAKSVAATGLDMHSRPWYQVLFPSYGDYKLPVYIWLASVSVKLFGVSEFALRLPSLLAGLGSLVLVFGLATKLDSLQPSTKNRSSRKSKSNAPWWAFSAVVVLAISPWAMTFSRTGFEGHVGQAVFGASMLSLQYSQTQKKRSKIWWLLIATVLGALATYTYFSVRFVWPVVFTLGVILFHTWQKKRLLLQLGQNVALVFGGLLLFTILLLPMFRSPLYSDSNRFRYGTDSVFNAFDHAVDSNILRQQAGAEVIDRLYFHRHVLLLKELANNYADHVSLSFLFVTGDANLRHGTGQHGLFFLTMLPFFLLGWIQLAKNQPKTGLWLLVWWLAALLPASVPETTPHALRSLNALLPLSLVLGAGIGASAYWVNQQLNSPKTRFWQRSELLVLTLLLISTLTFELARFGHYYLTIYPQRSSFDWQDGYQEIAAYVEDQKSQVDFVYVSSVDDRFHLWPMGYGPYHPREYQDLETKGFQFVQIENVDYDTIFDWLNYSEAPISDILYIASMSEINRWVTELDLQPLSSREFTTSDGVTRYKAIVVAKESFPEDRRTQLEETE